MRSYLKSIKSGVVTVLLTSSFSAHAVNPLSCDHAFQLNSALNNNRLDPIEATNLLKSIEKSDAKLLDPIFNQFESSTPADDGLSLFVKNQIVGNPNVNVVRQLTKKLLQSDLFFSRKFEKIMYSLSEEGIKFSDLSYDRQQETVKVGFRRIKELFQLDNKDFNDASYKDEQHALKKTYGSVMGQKEFLRARSELLSFIAQPLGTEVLQAMLYYTLSGANDLNGRVDSAFSADSKVRFTPLFRAAEAASRWNHQLYENYSYGSGVRFFSTIACIFVGLFGFPAAFTHRGLPIEYMDFMTNLYQASQLPRDASGLSLYAFTEFPIIAVLSSLVVFNPLTYHGLLLLEKAAQLEQFTLRKLMSFPERVARWLTFSLVKKPKNYFSFIRSRRRAKDAIANAVKEAAKNGVGVSNTLQVGLMTTAAEFNSLLDRNNYEFGFWQGRTSETLLEFKKLTDLSKVLTGETAMVLSANETVEAQFSSMILDQQKGRALMGERVKMLSMLNLIQSKESLLLESIEKLLLEKTGLDSRILQMKSELLNEAIEIEHARQMILARLNSTEGRQ